MAAFFNPNNIPKIELLRFTGSFVLSVRGPLSSRHTATSLSQLQPRRESAQELLRAKTILSLCGYKVPKSHENDYLLAALLRDTTYMFVRTKLNCYQYRHLIVLDIQWI